MDTYAVELNSFVDTILTKVYDLGAGRDMLFSSFNPDVCLLLSFKQPSIPVLFLSDAGASPVGDIRASSLQEAVRFASRWNLLGIVTQAEPLVLCPRLVRIVKESGLVCVSYGVLNNDGVNVEVSLPRISPISPIILDRPNPHSLYSTKSPKALTPSSSIPCWVSQTASFSAKTRASAHQALLRLPSLWATALPCRCLYSSRSRQTRPNKISSLPLFSN